MNNTILLEEQKNFYKKKISEKENQIKENTNSYESLRAFKNNVQQAEKNYYIMNRRKNDILLRMEQIQNRCLIAQRYNAGMKKSLKGTGLNIVGVAYAGLLLMISGKLRSYISKINEDERILEKYREKLEEVNSEIMKIEQAKGKNYV